MNIKVKTLLTGLLLTLSLNCSAWGQTYSVAALKEAPPKDHLSESVAGTIADEGVRVTRGTSTTYVDFWFCKDLAAMAGFKPTSELLYPFQPGQLIGVAKFARKGSDFRDQDIATGVYTMRYAQQPVDGAHVGTSPTRDFLLLVKAETDESTDVLAYESLTIQSADAAGSAHPAILCLQPVPADTAEFPSIRHDEQHDWWIIAVQVQTKSDGKSTPLPVGIVVAGVAPE